ncbi:hypothetical protein FJZ31_22115 [Candidatus Poribacteria bacterium]|nr:hypothetical protein [Candidatus Poribacteria bacterium]
MLKAMEAIYENGNIRFLSPSEKGIYKAIIVLLEQINNIEEDTLQKYKRLSSDFDFGLKADKEYARQLLDEHKELVYLQ